MSKELFETTADVLRLHLPSTKDPLISEAGGWVDFAGLYVAAILAGALQGRSRLRIADPDNRWESVYRQAIALKNAIELLPPIDRDEDALEVINSTIIKAQSSLKEARKFYQIRTKVRPEVALVVFYSRAIWMLETVHSRASLQQYFGADKKDLDLLWQAEVSLLRIGADRASPVPFHEKFDAPGPFGRFLEDLLAALNLRGAGSRRLSAASALRAANKLLSTLEEQIVSSC